MNTNTKLLEVGDVLYSKSYNKIYGTYTIERVTNTQAISGNARFKREYRFSADLIGSDRWSSTKYLLETEELKIELEKQRIIDLVNNKGLNHLSIEDLRQIKEMISEPTPERSVATEA